MLKIGGYFFGSQSSVRMPAVHLGCRKPIIIFSAPGRGALSMRRISLDSHSVRASATPSSTAKATW